MIAVVAVEKPTFTRKKIGKNQPKFGNKSQTAKITSTLANRNGAQNTKIGVYLPHVCRSLTVASI